MGAACRAGVFNFTDPLDETVFSVPGVLLGRKATAENGLTDDNHDGIADGADDWSVILSGITADHFSLYAADGYLDYSGGVVPI